MAINQATLARRLKEARECARVTQEVAAEALAVPRTAIAHIEAGNRAISTLELVEFAKLYGRDIASFFTEDDAPIPDDDALLTLYRVASEFRDQSKVKASVSKCIEMSRIGKSLEEILDMSRRTGPPAYTVDLPRSPAEAVQQGERTAADERKRIGIGDSPVLDMGDLITTQGVWASGAELPEGMSGLFLRHPSIGLLILVNYIDATTGERFSYAHEYAHCLLDRAQPVSITTSHNQTSLSEIRANAFAGAFLMPSGGVSAFLDSVDKGAPSRQTLHVYTPLGEHPDDAIEAQRRPAPGSQKIVYQDVAHLASYFRVSYAAAVFRLRNLGWISQTECTALLADTLHASHYLKLLRVIDDEVSVEEPKGGRHLMNQVAYLAIEAFRRDEISRGRVLEIAETLGIEKGSELVSLAKVALVG